MSIEVDKIVESLSQLDKDSLSSLTDVLIQLSGGDERKRRKKVKHEMSGGGSNVNSK